MNQKKETYECFAVVEEKEESRFKAEREFGLEKGLEKVELTEAGTEEIEEIVSRTRKDSEGDRHPSEFELQSDDPFIQKIAERKKELTIYDIQEDPFFEDEKDSCLKAFEQLGATLIVPLI